MKRVARAVVLAGFLAFFAGCSSGPTISSPTPMPPMPPVPTAPAPPAPGLSIASLAIEQLSVIVHPPLRQGESFWYEPRFLLRETSGNSGATIQKVVVFGPNGSDETGPGCWREILRVSAGGTLDIFYTEAGHRGLSYCAPESFGVTQSPQLRLSVTFADDDGRTGTVGAVATVVVPVP